MPCEVYSFCLFTHLYIQQIRFVEHLICANHCTKHCTCKSEFRLNPYLKNIHEYSKIWNNFAVGSLFHLCNSFPINMIYSLNWSQKTRFHFCLRPRIFPGNMWNYCFPGIVPLFHQWVRDRGGIQASESPLCAVKPTVSDPPTTGCHEDSTERLSCFTRAIKGVFKILKFSNEIYKGWLFSNLSTLPFCGKGKRR